MTFSKIMLAADITFLGLMLHMLKFELAVASPDNRSHITALRDDIARNEGRLQRLLIERISA